MALNLDAKASATHPAANGATEVSRETSQFLDFSRWVAAFLVVLSHVRGIVLVDYPAIAFRPNIALKLLYFASNLGHAAVVVFFVVSGFLIGGRTIIKMREKHFSLLDYAIHRSARIYIVLLPALLVGFVLDRVGTLVDNTGLYTHLGTFHVWSIDFSISERLSALTFLGNLFLLQTILVNPLGSNGPLWSLANEWWYYNIFGTAVFASFVLTRRAKISVCCYFIFMLLFLPVSIMVWFFVWLVGVGVAFLNERWKGWPAPVGYAVFLAAITTVRLLPPPEGLLQAFALDLLVAGGFSTAILCAKRAKIGFENLHKSLASFSYTTYLVHFPAMVLLATVCRRFFNFGIAEQPSLPAIAFSFALIGVLYFYAWAFAAVTERHTDMARKRIGRVIRRYCDLGSVRRI